MKRTIKAFVMGILMSLSVLGISCSGVNSSAPNEVQENASSENTEHSSGRYGWEDGSKFGN